MPKFKKWTSQISYATCLLLQHIVNQRVLMLHEVLLIRLIQLNSFTSVTSLHSVNAVTSENIRFILNTAFSSSFLHRSFVICGLFFSNKLHTPNAGFNFPVYAYVPIFCTDLQIFSLSYGVNCLPVC